jgi:hypothetical protein
MKDSEPTDLAHIPAGRDIPEMEIRYYLTRERFPDPPRHTGYGVKAVLIISGRPPEEAAVGDVTTSRAAMETLIHTLSRNSVTPLTLADVVGDYIAG